MAVVYSDVEEYDPLARDDYGTADCSEVTTRTVSNAFFDGPVDDAGEPGDGKEDKTEEEEQLKTVDQKEDRVKVDEDLGEVKEAEEGVKEQEHVEPKEGDGEEEEEEEEEEIPPKVKEVTFINDVPIYKPNHLLMDEKNHYKCVVYELVGFDDKVGGTYLVTAHDKEMVLRVEKIPGRIIGQELEFLKKVEADNKLPYFSQLHSGWNADGYAFYMLYYRWKSLVSWMQSLVLENRENTIEDSLYFITMEVSLNQECIRYVHKYSMLLRCLEPEMFHFDAAGRNLFLSDLSTIRADPGKRDWSIPVSWAGGPHYAPTNTGSVRARDEIEAWLYFFIEMIVGQLPWTGKLYDEIHQIESRPGCWSRQGAAFCLGRCYALAQYQMKEARALRRAYEDENGEGPNFSLDLPEVEDAVQWGSPFDLAVHTKPSLPPSPSSDDEVDEEGTTVSRRPSHADAPPLNTAAPAPMPTVVTTSPDATRPLKVGPVLKILAAIGTYLPENPIDN